ncbi:flagellar motor switch protein FliN [Nitrospira defluvii]|nr:flagellar motor switch protein FliN [Nitrospira defluvii]
MADETGEETASQGAAGEEKVVQESTEVQTGTSGTEKGVGETPSIEASPQPEAASLPSLEPVVPESALGNLDFILDVPLQITVILGSSKMLIKELLQLGQGSVVELEKMAGEPMDVLIGDRLIARGEVVVVNEKFGVRLTDIVSTVERINQLNN